MAFCWTFCMRRFAALCAHARATTFPRCALALYVLYLPAVLQVQPPSLFYYLLLVLPPAHAFGLWRWLLLRLPTGSWVGSLICPPCTATPIPPVHLRTACPMPTIPNLLLSHPWHGFYCLLYVLTRTLFLLFLPHCGSLVLPAFCNSILPTSILDYYTFPICLPTHACCHSALFGCFAVHWPWFVVLRQAGFQNPDINCCLISILSIQSSLPLPPSPFWKEKDKKDLFVLTFIIPFIFILYVWQQCVAAAFACIMVNSGVVIFLCALATPYTCTHFLCGSFTLALLPSFCICLFV